MRTNYTNQLLKYNRQLIQRNSLNLTRLLDLCEEAIVAFNILFKKKIKNYQLNENRIKNKFKQVSLCSFKFLNLFSLFVNSPSLTNFI